MPFRPTAVASLLCLLATAGSARAAPPAAVVEACPHTDPKLLVWRLSPGPDFHVCYGSPPGATHPTIGAYYGHAASFRYAAPAAREPGMLGGLPIEWQVGTTPDKKLKRETLFLLKTRPDPHATQVHVWIIADTAAELEQAKQLARDIDF